jgi:hypothetical protein
MFTLCSHIELSEAQELLYRIEMWDDGDTRIEELIAFVAEHGVAHAAFAEAVRRRPGTMITSAEVESARR